MGKVGGVLVCLLVALVFGGVGAFASSAIGSTLWDAHRAQSWVRVKADVIDASLETSRGSEGGVTFRNDGRYRYVFAGKPHVGARLGISSLGGSDNIDDWHEAVNARLKDALDAGKPVTVWVNPDDPAEAVLDREIRWGEVVFLIPFALAFGGVGVGGLVAMVFVVRAKAQGGAQDEILKSLGARDAAAPPDGSTGAGFLWLFAFFWNAIAFPIAILAVPDIVESGEWAGLLVLLFPLIGIFLLAAAVSATWSAWRERHGAGGITVRTRPVAAPPGAFAARAARAMFDPQGATAANFAARPSAPAEMEIPAATAEVEERDGTLTLRYSARRRLGLAVALLLMGAVLTVIGVALFVADAAFLGALLTLVLGGLADASAVALLVGKLVVTAKPGELAVEQTGLRGHKSWRLRREAIRAIRPTLSYAINDQPYYSLHADADAGQVPLGSSLKGAQLADTVARRICRALGAPLSLVSRPVTPPYFPSPTEDENGLAVTPTRRMP